MKKEPAKSFRDLIVWQKAHQLVLFVYRFSSRFPKTETYGLPQFDVRNWLVWRRSQETGDSIQEKNSEFLGSIQNYYSILSNLWLLIRKNQSF